MKKFKTFEEAFLWTFDEKENFFTIKNHFNLHDHDEVENIKDVFTTVNKHELEKYLLDNSYVEKINGVFIYNQ